MKKKNDEIKFDKIIIEIKQFNFIDVFFIENFSGPFGSPSGAPPFGRPGSSGPAFGSPHFASPGNFNAPQFGMPSNSPFTHGHPMAQMSGHMMGGPQPIDRMEQG